MAQENVDRARGRRDEAARLLERISDGDEEALRDIYRAYGRLAYTLAYRILRRDDLAEEAVQEAFLRVWRHAHRFDPSKAAFSTWLGRVTRNICIDLLRRKNPISLAGPLTDVERWLAVSEPLEQPVLDRVIIREAFLTLPEAQSRVLDMAYYQGLTHREITEALALPEGTVKSRMRLGLQKLRRHLDGPTS